MLIFITIILLKILFYRLQHSNNSRTQNGGPVEGVCATQGKNNLFLVTLSHYFVKKWNNSKSLKYLLIEKYSIVKENRFKHKFYIAFFRVWQI